MLYLYIYETESDYTHPFWDHTIKGKPAPIGIFYTLGIMLINFAVVLVVTALLGSVLGFIAGWFVWEIFMNIMSYKREKYPSELFWIMVGSVMYLICWFIPGIIIVFL